MQCQCRDLPRLRFDTLAAYRELVGRDTCAACCTHCWTAGTICDLNLYAAHDTGAICAETAIADDLCLTNQSCDCRRGRKLQVLDHQCGQPFPQWIVDQRQSRPLPCGEARYTW